MQLIPNSICGNGGNGGIAVNGTANGQNGRETSNGAKGGII